MTTTPDFAITLLVDQTPKEALDAITNVRGWWSEEIEGSTDKLDETFTYRYKDMHRCKMKLVELVAGRKAVWLVTENYFSFTHDEAEWTGTKIVFEIGRKAAKTQIRFTHLGLVPDYECFDICANAWSEYIRQSLYALITTGKGQPNLRENQNQ